MKSEADKRMYKALVHVLECGRFNFSGKEALAFNKVFEWVKLNEEKLYEAPKVKEPSGRKRK